MGEGIVQYRQEDEYNGSETEGVQQPSTLQKAQVRERIPAGTSVSTSDLLQIVPILETERTLAKGKVDKHPTENRVQGEESTIVKKMRGRVTNKKRERGKWKREGSRGGRWKCESVKLRDLLVSEEEREILGDIKIEDD